MAKISISERQGRVYLDAMRDAILWLSEEAETADATAVAIKKLGMDPHDEEQKANHYRLLVGQYKDEADRLEAKLDAVARRMAARKEK